MIGKRSYFKIWKKAFQIQVFQVLGITGGFGYLPWTVSRYVFFLHISVSYYIFVINLYHVRYSQCCQAEYCTPRSQVWFIVHNSSYFHWLTAPPYPEPLRPSGPPPYAPPSVPYPPPRPDVPSAPYNGPQQPPLPPPTSNQPCPPVSDTVNL